MDHQTKKARLRFACRAFRLSNFNQQQTLTFVDIETSVAGRAC